MTRTPVPLPRSVGTIGLLLFLAALAVLFGAGMFGYVMIRLNGSETQARHNLHMPWLLWVSTVLVLGVSLALHLAVDAVRRERQQSFRLWLRASLGLAVGFIAVQTPAMILLLRTHAALQAQGVKLHVYALIFFLVLLHALHVVGGVIALIRVMVHESHGDYDHEHYLPIHHAAMYWHFLDVVWLVMFGTFLAVG